jgi:hypothetical protein
LDETTVANHDCSPASFSLTVKRKKKKKKKFGEGKEEQEEGKIKGVVASLLFSMFPGKVP